MSGIQISENGAQNPKALLHVGNGDTDPTIVDPVGFIEGSLEVTGTLKADSIEGTLSTNIDQDQINGLEADLAAKADKATTLTPSGAVRIDGGTSAVDLSTNHTISVINATVAANGLMPSTDKLDLTLATSNASANQLVRRDGNALFSVGQTPTAAGHVAAKAYVDTQLTLRPMKLACRVVATTLQTMSGLPTIDDVTLLSGERVLLTAQFPASSNGIYTVASGSWTRATDLNELTELPVAMIPIAEGTTYAKTIWMLRQTPPYELGTTSLNFDAVFKYTAGEGLTLTNGEFAVDIENLELETSQIVGLDEDLDDIAALFTVFDAAKVDKADINLIRKGNLNTDFSVSSDTDAQRGTQLRGAVAASASGDIIQLNAGNIDLGALTHLEQTASTTIRGQGLDRTRIYSALPQGTDNGEAIITLNNNCTLEDLWVDATLTDGTYQIPVGSQKTTHTFTNATLRRVRITGQSDALFTWSSGNHSLKAYDSYFESSYDTVAILKSGNPSNGGGTYEFHDCHFIATGPFPGLDANNEGPPGRIANNIVVKSGTVLLVNPRIITSTTNASAEQTYGVATVASNTANVILINPYFDVTGAAGDVFDIFN